MRLENLPIIKQVREAFRHNKVKKCIEISREPDSKYINDDLYPFETDDYKFIWV